ncbi:MAG: DUF6263 family protein [Planctomycetales bacterium]|nr:DUF6263 family protein [Planctomycetales bacterium]
MTRRFHSLASLLAVAVAGLMAGASVAHAQATLELKYPERTKSSTQTESVVNQTLTLAGNDILTKANTFTTSTSHIGTRAADGTLAIVEKVESLQSELDLNGTKLQFDSANPDKKADLPQLEPLLDLYRAVVKFPMTRTLEAKTNKLKSVTLPVGEFEKLGEAAKDRFSPEKLKKATEQALVFLPDGPVKVGDKWERATEADLGGGQLMSFRTTYEYLGTVEQDGAKLDKIEGKAFEVSFAIVGNPMLQVTKSNLKIKESATTHLFDRERGHLVSKNAKVRIDGPITLVIGGMELEGKVDLTMEEKSTRQK